MSVRALASRAALAAYAGCAACASASLPSGCTPSLQPVAPPSGPSATPPAALTPSHMVPAGPTREPAADAGTPAEAAAAPITAPVGLATAGVHVARGQRQPVQLRGTLTAIEPAGSTAAESKSPEDAWMLLQFAAPGPRSVRLLLTPANVPLPFSEGDFVRSDIDCRKGGWTRICDGVFRDRSQRLLLAIAGSGDTRLLPDWTIERGPLALSEIRAQKPKSVRHTHALIVRHARQTLTLTPHEWHVLRSNDGSWLVEGHAVSWEGARPADAPDYLHYAIVRAR